MLYRFILLYPTNLGVFGTRLHVKKIVFDSVKKKKRIKKILVRRIELFRFHVFNWSSGGSATWAEIQGF